MEFTLPEIEGYSLKFSTPEDEVLAALTRQTYLKTLSPRMRSGPLQGAFLTMLSSLMRPELILEIGTFTGYSAICLAKGLKTGGRLVTIDVNEETEAIAQKAFQDAGLQYCIHPITGNAIEIIPRIDGPFDLVFIDADKKNYAAYYDLVFDKVRAGGLIIADNVLWSGKILQPEDKMDTDTLAIHSFNRKVQNDIRVECLILPIRDGLMLVKKK